MSCASRRSFLQAAGSFAAASSFSMPAFASNGWTSKVYVAGNLEQERKQELEQEKERRLFIKCKRTGEVFDDVYRNGILVYDDALSDLDHLMRDWRRDAVIEMDRKLIDILAGIQEEVGYEEPITVISGYRTRKTNSMIRKAAKNSYHVKGMAVDLRVEGVSTRVLRKLARREKVGGIGYYPRRGFVHLDTGPTRSWRG